MAKRKAPSEDNPNQDICDILIGYVVRNSIRKLAQYEKNVSKNIYKHNAYRKAASVVASHPTKITSGKEARKLSGVGEKISKKIDEFLETGKLKKLENIQHDKKSTAINLLARISGIGPVKAENLVNLGIETIEDLKRNIDKLNHHQLIGLRYFEEFETKIPRMETEKIEEIMQTEIKKLDENYTLTICGSYRRGKSESGDIDVLITHPSYTNEKNKHSHMLKNIVNALEQCDLITDTISLGSTKFMGVCRLNKDSIARRLDIRLIPYNQYYCGILYFTGSDQFNKELRSHAIEKGFTLNEYSLRPLGITGIPGEPVEIHSEEDVFDYIDFIYKEPCERNK